MATQLQEGPHLKRLALAFLYMFASILLLTRIDFFVNSMLQFQYGLKFNTAWYNEYVMYYVLLWQTSVLLFTVIFRNLRWAIIYETFVLSAGQDIFFYLLWVGRFDLPPWWWTPQYNIFGWWDGPSQVMYTLSVVAVAFLVTKLPVQRWIKWSH